MTRPEVLGFLSAPDRESSLRAVSLAILKIRSSGTTYKEIAKAIDCSADTVAAAANEVTLLSLDSVLRLCFFWPTAAETILGLTKPIAEKPTVEDRIELIERQLEAIRKAAVDCEGGHE